jgi:hypothetical protein
MIHLEQKWFYPDIAHASSFPHAEMDSIRRCSDLILKIHRQRVDTLHWQNERNNKHK